MLQIFFLWYEDVQLIVDFLILLLFTEKGRTGHSISIH